MIINLSVHYITRQNAVHTHLTTHARTPSTEYDVTGVNPTALVGSTYLPPGCTLGTGNLGGISTSGAGASQWFDTEGFPSMFADGSAMTFPCYNVANGSTIVDSTVAASASVKTIAVVKSDGSVNYGTTSALPYYGQGVAQVR